MQIHTRRLCTDGCHQSCGKQACYLTVPDAWCACPSVHFEASTSSEFSFLLESRSEKLVKDDFSGSNPMWAKISTYSLFNRKPYLHGNSIAISSDLMDPSRQLVSLQPESSTWALEHTRMCIISTNNCDITSIKPIPSVPALEQPPGYFAELRGIVTESITVAFANRLGLLGQQEILSHLARYLKVSSPVISGNECAGHLLSVIGSCS